MPLDHQGALSGVTYRIPALADVRDPSVAFAAFADSIPALPPIPAVLQIEQVTASKTADANTLYINETATPITLTLPATGQAGDRILASQVGAGTITLSGIGSGVPVTAGANTAVSAVWDGAKWVGLPFSFSGTRPVESSGGTVVDLNGFRYHLFTAPGVYTFTSHKALSVEGYVVGAGKNGTDGSTTAAGVAGGGGEVKPLAAVPVKDWTFTTVVVGADGSVSSFGTEVAAGGTLGGTNPPTVLSGDWLTVLKETVLGGPGTVSGATGDTYGKGGGAGIKVLAPYTQETESYSYTTGGPFSYDCSYGARREDYQDGVRDVYGDPCQGTYKDACPGGWWCINAGSANATCWTQVPTYATRWHCDSGGSLSGTTCVKTCYGDSTQHHTGTRPKACNAGYTASGGQCVDPRSPLGGKAGGGLVAVRYALA